MEYQTQIQDILEREERLIHIQQHLDSWIQYSTMHMLDEKTYGEMLMEMTAETAISYVNSITMEYTEEEIKKATQYLKLLYYEI